LCGVEADAGRTGAYYSLRSGWILGHGRPKIQTVGNGALAQSLSGINDPVNKSAPNSPLIWQRVEMNDYQTYLCLSRPRRASAPVKNI
jgi:hypothetical protein